MRIDKISGRVDYYCAIDMRDGRYKICGEQGTYIEENPHKIAKSVNEISFIDVMRTLMIVLCCMLIFGK